MRTISQRELRNDSGEIMRGLDRGESYRVTRRGVAVGILSPTRTDPLSAVTIRHGRSGMDFPEGVRRGERTDEVLRELRGTR